MAIVERDPWRTQYFHGVACPDDVFIPTEDGDSYRLYPEHRWIYNKLLIAETQGLECGPHGVVPERFPVFSKPIYNLRGMGMETRIFDDLAGYLAGRDPGHMWVTLLTGEHLSSDVAVVRGEPLWWRHVQGAPLGDAMFDYWTVLDDIRPEVEEPCGEWIRRNFGSYTGMLNLETIGGKIIEGHLRFADQWPDLYGRNWVHALVELYEHHRWSYADEDRRRGYSVVLHGSHGIRYHHPAPEVVNEILADPQVSSVQVTFFEDKPPEHHAMPPGGFRIGIVNCWDLEVGTAARERLALAFWSTQDLLPKRRRKKRP